MAPHLPALSSFDHLRLSDKDRLKLRKPVVEKMRRDRINSCIDQLKKLLEKELRGQDPSNKLEKADILEMTVSFLKQRRQLPAVQAQRDFNEGYSHCWRESLNFLNAHSNKQQSAQQFKQLHQVQKASKESVCSPPQPSTKHNSASQPIWRPW